jgi:diphthine-ammonia ligase
MYAVASSGGKDSTYALHYARESGLAVSCLFHVYGTEYGRVRFHGYEPRVVAAQADCLGLDIILEPTPADRFDEAFTAALDRAQQAGLRGIIFGNLHLADVAAYYRRLVEAAGLEYVDILWGKDPGDVLVSFIDAGFRAVVTSVWLERLGREFLGREIDRSFAADLSRQPSVDPCGENGEYHSLVWDGPCFRRPLPFSVSGVHETASNVFLDVRVPEARQTPAGSTEPGQGEAC